MTLGDAAERYVKLALGLDQHDSGCVDAYFGPPQWRAEIVASAADLATIRGGAEQLAAELAETDDSTDRHRHLLGQVRAVAARADLVGGTVLSFDDEARALYDADVPSHEESEFDQVLAELAELLPSGASLPETYASYVQAFVVAPDRVPETIDLAIAECRRRTVAHLELPEGESYELTFTRGEAWGGQTYYQGGFRSKILVNLDVPLRIDRILDLTGHEGYPGHHVSGLLMERDLVEAKGWPEFSVLFLYSPAALVAEGTAMLAVEMAFGTQGRAEYEREVLYPAAGLDPAGAERYDRVRTLAGQLSFAVNEVARRYLGGSVTAPEAQAWLVRYALMTPAQAEQRVRFIERYRKLRDQLQRRRTTRPRHSRQPAGSPVGDVRGTAALSAARSRSELTPQSRSMSS